MIDYLKFTFSPYFTRGNEYTNKNGTHVGYRLQIIASSYSRWNVYFQRRAEERKRGRDIQMKHAEPRVVTSGLCRKVHTKRSHPALENHLHGGDGDDVDDDDDDDDNGHSCVQLVLTGDISSLDIECTSR